MNIGQGKAKEMRGCPSGVNIGQGNTKKMKWCPKSSEHRTKQGQKEDVMSEAKWSSDKCNPKKCDYVRRNTTLPSKQKLFIIGITCFSNRGKVFLKYPAKCPF